MRRFSTRPCTARNIRRAVVVHRSRCKDHIARPRALLV